MDYSHKINRKMEIEFHSKLLICHTFKQQMQLNRQEGKLLAQIINCIQYRF